MGVLIQVPGENEPRLLWGRTRYVNPGYFQTLGIPLLRGRFFNEEDETQDTQQSIILNEAAVRHHFPNRNPIGLRTSPPRGEGRVPLEIVGVVRDIPSVGLNVDPPPTVYLCTPQWITHSANFVVRTLNHPLNLVTAVRFQNLL